MIKFPYGNSDFYKIITEDYCYLDRTDRIPLLEAMGDSLLFLRPRRFGKSLLLTMLENYYDIDKAAEFARLFGALAVGRDPTPLHNQYLVMRWDFSIVTPKPTYEGQERVLPSYLNVEIANFVSKYAALLPNLVMERLYAHRIREMLLPDAGVRDEVVAVGFEKLVWQAVSL